MDHGRVVHSGVGVRIDHQRPLGVVRSNLNRLASPAHLELALLGAMLPVEAAVFAEASRPLGATLFTLTASAAATIIWDAARTARPSGGPQVAVPAASAEMASSSRRAAPTNASVQIADAIGRIHALAGRTALAVLTIRPPDRSSAHDMNAARKHLEATLRRVSRSTDILVALDERRLALVLAGCDGADAAIFGQRLTVAIHNRPAPGIGPAAVQVTTLEYDPDRFGTPARFLAAFGLAATGVATEAPVRALDGHDIRRRILGEGFANYRPGGFGGRMRGRLVRPLRLVA